MRDEISRDDKAIAFKVAQMNIGGYRRHLLLCTGPKCCSEEQGYAVWGYLKRRLKELGLVDGSVYRSKVGCLRICQQGPIALVYPDGVWYRLVDETVCERIIQEHLIGGMEVEDYIFARNPL